MCPTNLRCVACNRSAPTPSAPKAEQVPQEAQIEELIFQIRKQHPLSPSRIGPMFFWTDTYAAALIVAERERYAIAVNVALIDTKGVLMRERDQLHRELEQATQTIARAEKDRIDHAQQLAALQRENAELKQEAEAAHYDAIERDEKADL